MSLTPETSTALVSQLQGSSQGVDPYDVDPNHGLYSQNCTFVIGQGANGTIQAATRGGSSQVAQIPTGYGPVTYIASWYFTLNGVQNCYVVMYSPTVGLFFYDQAGAAFSGVIIAVTGAGDICIAIDGTRLYAAFADSTGRAGVSQAYVYGILANGTFTNPAVDTLFAPPQNFGNISAPQLFLTPTVTSGGACTIGFRRLAFLVTTRNGYTGPLNPTNGAGLLFTPSATTTSVNQTIQCQFSTSVSGLPSYLNPTDAPTPPVIQVVMTTTTNLQQYFTVPGANVTITSGTTFPLDINVSIVDADLAATGTDVTQNQDLLTQTVAEFGVPSTGPFDPWAIFLYSSRMAYCTLDQSGFPVVYFSNQNAYQVLGAAFSGVYLEGRQIPVQGCSLGGVCYIATLSALYATQDNGGLPATWTPPSRVDGSVGVLASSCLLAVGGKILLASEKGLYLYRGGAFPQTAMSYWQTTDWNRINWTSPAQVQICDDALERVIRVIAPLKVVIVGASNTNPITITTAIMIGANPIAYPHLFQTGLSVTIAGVGGNTAANGTQTITVTGPNTFTIPVAGNGAYTSGGSAAPNTPNAVMSWFYAPGDAPGQPFYSIHAYTSYRATAMNIIRNIATNQDETWWGPAGSNPGNLIRHVIPGEVPQYRDVDLNGNAVAINSLYETSLLPNSQDESCTIHDYSGMNLRVSGIGSLNVTAYSLDHGMAIVPLASPLTLAAGPAREYLMKWFVRSEQESISFGTNAIDAYFIAAIVRAYYTNSLPQR